MATKQVPSVGRVVHFWTRGPQGPYAAIVTGVDEPGNPDSPLTLIWFPTKHPEWATRVLPLALSPGRGWAWPPHVPAVEVPDGN